MSLVKRIDFAGEGMRWGTDVLPIPAAMELRTELLTPREYVHTSVFPLVSCPVANGRITIINNVLVGLPSQGPLGTTVGRGQSPPVFVPGVSHIDVALVRHGLEGRIDIDDEPLMTAQGIQVASGSLGLAAIVAGMAEDGVLTGRETDAKTAIAAAINAGQSTTVATAWQLSGGNSAGAISAAYESMVAALGWRFPRSALKVTLVGAAVDAGVRADDFLAQYRPTDSNLGVAGSLATYWRVGAVEFVESPTEAVVWPSYAIISLMPTAQTIGYGNTLRWDKSMGAVTPNVPGYLNKAVAYIEWYQVKVHRSAGVFVIESPEVSD